ncbi:MAG: hypothetical protein JWR59_2064 [Brevundimonas sp.]|nr:hypothetical protein [Brevundimonas sp.]
MTPGLLLPLGLAALAALILPLILHIARRTEDRPTDFAALRWLRQKPRPKSRLRFDERLLLAIRLLLLALVALWLAHPVLFGAADKGPYVAVAPGADLARAGKVEGRAVADYPKAHWLARDFPALDTPAPPVVASTASLIRQLDADLAATTPLILVVPEVLAGADAERPRLSRRVEWRVASGPAPTPPLVPEPIPALSIRHDAAHAGALRYLRAVALSWQPQGRDVDLDIAGLDEPMPAKDRSLIWLGSGTLPPALLQWIESGGAALIASDALMPAGERIPVWPDDLGQPLIEMTPHGSGRLLRFTRPLTPAELPQLLEPDFPARLKAALAPAQTAPTRVAAADYAPSLGARHVEPAPLDLRPWLAVLIGLILLGERWLATRRSRGISP